jgi:hypothetical protein
MNSTYLRRVLLAKAQEYAARYGVPVTQEAESALIFARSESGHGNFHPESYAAILRNPEWKARLDKPHPQFAGTGVAELDSSNSSDALLMNIFCHPRASRWKSLHQLLQASWSSPDIGWPFRFPNETTSRPTECDMHLDGVLFEAKLTEVDFTSKDLGTVQGYDSAEDVFHLDGMLSSKGRVENYQLVRNMLAAERNGYRFALLVDWRRPDLIRRFVDTVAKITPFALRSRCSFLTWQEITAVVGEDLREYLTAKYGF